MPNTCKASARSVEGFDHVPFGNMNAVRDAIGPQTAGILVEPIQGEGGVRPASLRFLQELRAACDEYGLLLGLDEVQCGMGRTGKLFAHEWAGIEPDVMSAAKGIAGGFPMGAVLAKEAVARYLVPGTHGTTFGGNPLACAAANAVLDVVLAPGFLDEVDRKGRQLWRALELIVRDEPEVFSDVRGAGLILGLKCRVPNTEVQAAFMAEGLLTVGAGDNVVRLVPPLVVTDEDIAAAVEMVRRGARRCRPSACAGCGKVSGAVRRLRPDDGFAPAARQPRHFLDIRDFEPAVLRQMLDVSRGFKQAGVPSSRPLAGRTLAMIFEKPSTRTRVSFEVAMRQLGGEVVVLQGSEMQLGRGETVADTARVLSRYVDAIMLRTDDAAKLAELADIRHRAGDQRADQQVAIPAS